MKTPSQKLSISLCVAALLALAPGCGEEKLTQPNSNTNPHGTPHRDARVAKLGELEYKILNADTLKADGTKLAGSGEILFVKPLKEDSRIALSFELAPRGTLSLVTNSDDALKTGLKVTFTRIEKVVRLTVETSSGAGRFRGDDETPKIFPLALDGSKPITMEIDIHGHGHLRIFSGGKSSRVIGFDKQTRFFAGLLLGGVNVTDAKAGPSTIRD